MASFLKQSLIGSRIRIAVARNPSLIGMVGFITDETKHTFILNTDKGFKRVLKDSIVIEFPNKQVRLDGKLLIGRPEERIKKK